MILRIEKAQAIGPTHVRVVFNNGVAKAVDLLPLLSGPVFDPLHEPAAFAEMKLDADCGTVVWPNGADLVPEAILELQELGPVSSDD